MKDHERQWKAMHSWSFCMWIFGFQVFANLLILNGLQNRYRRQVGVIPKASRRQVPCNLRKETKPRTNGSVRKFITADYYNRRLLGNALITQADGHCPPALFVHRLGTLVLCTLSLSTFVTLTFLSLVLYWLGYLVLSTLSLYLTSWPWAL